MPSSHDTNETNAQFAAGWKECEDLINRHQIKKEMSFDWPAKYDLAWGSGLSDAITYLLGTINRGWTTLGTDGISIT